MYIGDKGTRGLESLEIYRFGALLGVLRFEDTSLSGRAIQGYQPLGV